MKQTDSLLHQTRRRFLGMMTALGSMFAWPARGEQKSNLSDHEAAFYRKGRKDDIDTS